MLMERHDIRDTSLRCWRQRLVQFTRQLTLSILRLPTAALAMPTPTTCQHVATAYISVASCAELKTWPLRSRTGLEHVTIA